VRLRTNPVTIHLRNLTRALGLNRYVGRLIVSEDYEESFRNEMFRALRQGDCVWDVGANVGLYTTGFSEKVGLSGKVFAFEPSEINLSRLREAVRGLTNVSVIPRALGDREAHVIFQQGDDDLGATSRIFDETTGNSATTSSVEMTTGDRLVESGVVSRPNLIKIDTEGHELEVLRGMEKSPEDVSSEWFVSKCISVSSRLAS
jgi:FkbM family methyltransferase